MRRGVLALAGLMAPLLVAPAVGRAGSSFEEQFDAAFRPDPGRTAAARLGEAATRGGKPVAATPGVRTVKRSPAAPGVQPSRQGGAIFGPPAPDAVPAAVVRNGLLGPRELMMIAAQGHPDVLSARARARSAEAGIAAAKAEYLPAPEGSLDLSGGMSSASVGVGVPLYAGGRLDAALERARALRQAADAGVAQARQQLGFSVIDAFAQWSVAVRSEVVKRRELDRLNERLGLIQRRIAAGASALSDEQLVWSRIRQAQGDLAGYRANAVAALAVLSQLTGTVLADGQLDQASVLPLLPDCNLLLSRGIIGAPGVVRAERDVDAARAAVRGTRASLLPTVTGRVAYTRTRYAPPDSAADRNDLRAYLTVSVAPGAGFGAAARTRAAEADVDAAIETLGSVRRSLAARIEGQCAARTAAVALREQLVSARNSTEGVYDSYTRLFVAGKRSWLDVINAAREVSSVDLALVQSEERIRATTWTLLLLAGDEALEVEREQ